MDELVQRLSEGDHPVVASRARTAAELAESVERGYVLIEFTDTQGGTEVGVSIDRSASDLGAADFDRGTGTARLVGDLTLNGIPVRCTAEIELGTLRGTGRLDSAG